MSEPTQSPETETTEQPDQTPAQKAMTDLLGLIQTEAENTGWSTEVVSLGETQVILGLTSPDNINFSLSMNPTP